MSGTVQIVTEGASGTREVLKSSNQALTVNVGGSPGTAVTPTVSSTPTGLLNITMTGVNLLVGFRAVAGSLSDAEAGQSLSDGFPNVVQAGPDSEITFTLSTAVTRLDVVGLNAAAYEVGTGSVELIASQAEAEAEQTTFDFGTAVSKIVVTMLPVDSTNLIGQIMVEGYSYA